MSLLELALWKVKIEDSKEDHGDAVEDFSKKMKMDLLEFRLQCHISCGAGHVVHNVLPFLLSPDFVRSYVYIDSGNEFDDDDAEEDDDDIVDDEVEDDGEEDSN
jgi:hypothetical protein